MANSKTAAAGKLLGACRKGANGLAAKLNSTAAALAACNADSRKMEAQLRWGLKCA
jgi:hypothetical protein